MLIGVIERNTCQCNFIQFRREWLYNAAVRYRDNIHGVVVLLSHFCTPNHPLSSPSSVSLPCTFVVLMFDVKSTQTLVIIRINYGKRGKMHSSQDCS